MRKCKNCSKEKSRRKQRHSHTPEYQVSEYGLAKIVSTPKIIVINDEYMLEVMLKTQRKTKTLVKQVGKLRNQVKKLQRSIEQSDWERRNQRNSHDFRSLENQDLIGSKKVKSRTSSINSSKNRQIGRFTKASEGESQSFSKNSFKQLIPQTIKNENFIKNKEEGQLYESRKSKKQQRHEFISFSEEVENNYMLNFEKNCKKDFKQQKTKTNQPNMPSKYFSNDDKNTFLKYTKAQKPKQQKYSNHSDTLTFSINQGSSEKGSTKNSTIELKNSIQKYIPSYQQVQSSESSYLISNDSLENSIQMARLKREFEQLIIQEKSAPESEKKRIRSRVQALSQMLGNIKN